VERVFGESGQLSGFSLEARGLPAGRYNVVAFAYSSVAGAFNNVAAAEITVVSTPLTMIDTPRGGTVVQPFTIAGWAIDASSSAGPGVDAVDVWAYPPTGPPVFVGTASYGWSRPDVAAAFGPQFEHSAFTIDVTGLAPGTYMMAVFAHNALTNRFESAQTVTVTVEGTPGAAAVSMPHKER
jgi:hypothetical protein